MRVLVDISTRTEEPPGRGNAASGLCGGERAPDGIGCGKAMNNHRSQRNYY